MSAQVAALRELLQNRFPGAVPLPERGAGAVATGIEALDGAFPEGGLPRGRLTAWAPGGGAAAVLRSACREVVERGERAAWVDGGGRVAGEAWGNEALLFRTSGGVEALECAETLVRSGGFALVVLTGTRTGDAERVRLTRVVREGGSALVTVDSGGFMAAMRVTTRIGAGDYLWRPDPFGEPADLDSVLVRARVTAVGWSADAEFSLTVSSHDLRLSLEPALGDRRGAAG